MTETKGPVRLRLVLTCVGVVIGLLGAWWFSGWNLDLQGILFYLSLLAVPYAMYLLLLRSHAGSLWIGLLLASLVVSIQVMVTWAWEGGSSTAPLGYLWLPLAGSAIVAVAAVLERVGN